MTEWISVKDRLPDKKTKYASEYGVPVLVFNRREHRPQPFECIFSFVDNWFNSYHYGPNGNEWIGIDVTDWAEMPEPPQQYKG